MHILFLLLGCPGKEKQILNASKTYVKSGNLWVRRGTILKAVGIIEAPYIKDKKVFYADR